MRRFVTTFLLLASISSLSYAAKNCPSDSHQRLVSGRFSLCLLPKFLSGATLANGGGSGAGLLVKLHDGAFFGMEIFTPAMDSLPDTFDMRTYPEFALGMKAPNGMTKEQEERVTNSVAILKDQFGATKPVKYKKNNKTIYTISKPGSTQTLITLDDVKDQVLFLNFGKMDEQTVQSIIGGVQ